MAGCEELIHVAADYSCYLIGHSHQLLVWLFLSIGSGRIRIGIAYCIYRCDLGRTHAGFQIAWQRLGPIFKARRCHLKLSIKEDISRQSPKP